KNGAFITFNEEQKQVMSALSDVMKNYADKKNPDTIKMPLFRALYLDELLAEKESVELKKNREYRKLIGKMRSYENGDYEVPQSLEAVLREYQRDGFYWIKTLKENGFGGILADDMGLGKTLQILAFLLSEKEQGKVGDELRTLIVAPASLVYNWKKEVERFTPQLSVCVMAGTAHERKELIKNQTSNVDVWITSYDLLKRDIELYQDIVFANEIIDEAQYIKNQTTHAAKSVRLVNSSFRMALTGTPMENRLSELWSIFDYLMPGFLYGYTRFRSEIETPIVYDKDEDAMTRLRAMIHPFILRRLKKDVLKELPEKQEEIVTVALSGEQKKLYQAHSQRLKMFLENQNDEDFAQNKLQILAELTKLRQLCCGPELLLENYKGENAKLETCIELITQAIAGGHKILLFSQFTSMLDLIGEELKKAKIDYYRIDGSVKKEARMEMVEQFQNPQNQVSVFCISLKAGGTGLNLTAADIVIHYDPWWNKAAQNQATDRAHRIGQKHAINVYQLIAEETIEQKICELQQVKEDLAEEVLSGEGISSTQFNKNEIMNLLEK
ncbi:MAG: SNF2-related protein, partial [Lachnospiraceae bacterium]|nr:SNF2-related protein [Lachnospiraceae bacterium]